MEHPEWFTVLSEDPRWHGKDPERYIKRIEATFPDVDLNLESHSAYEWLQSSKGLKKKVLRGFWINWLKNTVGARNGKSGSSLRPNLQESDQADKLRADRLSQRRGGV